MPESEDLPVYNARDSSPEPGVCNAAVMQLPPAGTIPLDVDSPILCVLTRRRSQYYLSNFLMRTGRDLPVQFACIV